MLPERLAAKLLEIAERFKELQQTAIAKPGDDPKIAALKVDVQKAIEAGDLGKADALLADVEVEQRQARERLSANEAETAAQRGDIAMTRLRYGEAATHYADAAAVLSSESSGDRNGSITSTEKPTLFISKGTNLATMLLCMRRSIVTAASSTCNPANHVPLQWASERRTISASRSVALGERESGTDKLEQAVAAYREVLKERTRERVPLDWASDAEQSWDRTLRG